MKFHSPEKITLPFRILIIFVVCIFLSSCTAAPEVQQSTEPSSATPTPDYEAGSIIVSSKDGAKMIFVPAGEFLMGSQDGAEDEKPAHLVYLDAYWIDQTEITNSMYALCVQAGACQQPFETYYYGDPEFDDSPVDYVTWDDASTYCDWAGRRLPTEAEWEKAASWDETSDQKRVFPWGNTIDCTFANIYFEGAVESDCEGYPFNTGAPVKAGSYPSGASYYGVLDMSGNVTEWVTDFYDDTFYQKSPSANPTGPKRGKDHVLRGGSFLSTPDEVHTS